MNAKVIGSRTAPCDSGYHMKVHIHEVYCHCDN